MIGSKLLVLKSMADWLENMLSAEGTFESGP